MKNISTVIFLIISIGTIVVSAVPKEQDDSFVFPDEYSRIMTQKTKYLEPRSTKTRPKNNNNNNNINNRNASSHFYQISLNIARSLAEADDIDSFVENLVENKDQFRRDLQQEESFLGISSRFGETTKPKWSTDKVPCIPLLQTVSLKPENQDQGLIYTPNCARVNRCSGCCSPPLFSCQPTKVTTKLFKVNELEIINNKIRYARRITVPVEEHEECKCACVTKKEDCRSDRDYLENECRCECNMNSAEEQERLRLCESKPDRSWNHYTCTCMRKECQEIDNVNTLCLSRNN